jgi:hypothetical protein
MSQKKILVVDDSSHARLALQVRLNANHYHSGCAGEGVTSRGSGHVAGNCAGSVGLLREG